MGHSKTPWKIGSSIHGKSVIFLVGDEPEHTLGPDENWIDCNTEANARRIVACINACRDIETEVLEMETGSTALFGRIAGKLTGDNLKLRDSVASLTAQRDELLAVLEYVADETCGWLHGDAMEKARAVIQKVRGGE